MPPCFSQIRNAQRIDYNINSSRLIKLATIGIDIKTRVRTIIFKGQSESYDMQIVVDKISE